MEWIKTSKQLPPIGQWVLVTKNDYQKPWEIECFMGVRIGTEYCHNENGEWVEEEYEYNGWTSGHGDIGSNDPIAWMPLPEPYKAERDVK